MIIDNKWYGHRQILAEYCGVRDQPAFATIAHGWDSFPEGEGLQPAGRIDAAPFLVWNKLLEAGARSNGVKNVRAIGAPFLYLLELMKSQEPPATEGQGTIAFPIHSSQAYGISYDLAAFIEKVCAENPPPFTISLPQHDLANASMLATFKDAGFRVVSFGSRSNRHFLCGLLKELRAHSTVVTNCPSSALFYGLALGKRGRVMGTRPVQHPGDFILARHHAVIRQRYPRLFDEGAGPQDANEIASIELGRDCMLPPDELAAVLGWSNAAKRACARIVETLVALKYGRRAVAGEDETTIIRGGRLRLPLSWRPPWQ
jgi:hypothetical protein